MPRAFSTDIVYVRLRRPFMPSAVRDVGAIGNIENNVKFFTLFQARRPTCAASRFLSQIRP